MDDLCPGLLVRVCLSMADACGTFSPPVSQPLQGDACGLPATTV